MNPLETAVAEFNAAFCYQITVPVSDYALDVMIDIAKDRGRDDISKKLSVAKYEANKPADVL
jgi:hypothetical protein